MVVKAVVFDCDGVVLKKPAQKYSDKLIMEHGANRELVEEFFRVVFAGKCQLGLADLKFELNQAIPNWGVSLTVDEILSEWFESDSNIDVEVANVIKLLRGAGIKCYLATNQEMFRAKYLMENTELKNLMDGFFFSYMYGVSKPSEAFYDRVFEKICSEIGCSIGEIAFTDDTQKNVDGAQKYGIKTYFYENCRGLVDFLESLGV